MPVNPTYPGVYIEEVPSGVRTITGVATSIAAFIDFFRRGPLNQAVQIFSIGDLEREFGGLDTLSEASYAIQQFFLNGGSEAYVVRTASGEFSSAAVEIQSDIEGAGALTVEAINPGHWGNHLRISVDYPEPNSEDRFNLNISLVEHQNGNPTIIQSEDFLNLTMETEDQRFVQTVVNDALSGSSLVRVTATPGDPPLLNGSLSGLLDPFPILSSGQPTMDVTIESEGSATATLSAVPTDLSQARQLLEAAIRAAMPANRAFSQARVTVVDNSLRILAGPTNPQARITFDAGTDATASDLGLTTGTQVAGILSDDLAPAFPIAAGSLQVTIGAVEHTIDLEQMNDLASARDQLESQIRQADGSLPFAHARVAMYTDGGEQRLIILAGVSTDTVTGISISAVVPASPVSALESGAASLITALVSENLSPAARISAGATVNVTIGGTAPDPPGIVIGTAADSFSAIAEALQTAIRGADANATFTDARATAYASGSDNRLIVLAGNSGDEVAFETAEADADTVQLLALNAGVLQANLQSYVLGIVGPLNGTAQGLGETGDDGDPPDGEALIGDPEAKTGIFALEDVDLFNILCLPRTAMVSGDNAMTDSEAAAVITAATNYCEQRRAFFIADTPSTINGIQQIKEWLEANATLRHPNAALYFSRTQIADPLNNFRLRSIGASGTMAGLYARTDSTRGVWKAPAGIEASLNNVQQLDYTPSDPENGTLNPLGINCLRNFPVYGNVSWGARTLFGSNERGSEWKYISIRRLANFIEESLFRGTQWVVFEPNDEPLWGQIRLNIGAFMQNLFRQGAFQGSTPREAYLVKCDSETTTQNDINQGIVNIIVGFAPLKPAEFVIIKIQQLAGQIQT